MKLVAKLALSQIQGNKNRSVMTLLGIGLSTAMLTAVCGFVASAKAVLEKALGYSYDNNNYNATLLAMGAVLGTIIIAASVIVVSNAFRISANERTRQFGILKSVGATKKQIASSVLYEGLLLCVIGIPAGIAVGLLISLAGTSILSNLLQSLYSGGTLYVDSESVAVLTVPFSAPPFLFLVAIFTSLGTVLLSAWIPARKAAKIPAIDAIRGAGEVSAKKVSYRTPRLIQSLFGFEGVLAAKSLRRSRRSFRATVLSLTISIVLLIAAGSFGLLMERSTNVMMADIDANAGVEWISETIMSYDENGEVAKISYSYMDAVDANAITEQLRAYPDTVVFGAGGTRHYKAVLPDGTIHADGVLMSVDPQHYEELCKVAGVPVGSNLLLNYRKEVVDGKRKVYTPYPFADIQDIPISFTSVDHEVFVINIAGQLTEQDIPSEIMNLMTRLGFQLTVIVPSCRSATYTWFTKTNDVAGFIAYAEPILESYAPTLDENFANISCEDIADITKQLRDLVRTIMLFVYGFVVMLTLIAVTSVISTISTNIRSRAREFAVLESVGMTKAGIKKMLNLESILCSAQSLLIGIPLGLLGAYYLYRAMGLSVELYFEFPWVLIGECILGVFAVTWITMRYAASRLKDGNIIETIRGE